MVSILLYLLFIIYKISIIYISYIYFNYYSISFNIYIFYLYIFFSFIQAIYYFINNLPKKKPPYSPRILFRYNCVITIFMENIIYISTLSILFYTYNIQLYLLIKLFCILTSINYIFLFIHNLFFTFIIYKSKIYIYRISFIILTLLFIYFLFFPLFFLIYELIFRNNLQPKEYHISLLILLVNITITYLFYIKKTKSILKNIAYLSKINISNNFLIINIIKNIDEAGIIQTAIYDLQKRINQDKSNILLLNNYISKELRDKISKNGLKLNNEKIEVTICSFKYNLPYNEVSDEELITINHKLIKIFGEYSTDYDAYPFFNFNNIYLIFGLPFNYEHQRINAIESAIRIINDINIISRESEIKIPVFCGVYTGEILPSKFELYGKHNFMYSIIGQSLYYVDKIKEYAEQNSIPLLACNKSMDKLKMRFYVIRNVNIKINDNEEIETLEIRL